jgi:hypothetical protein
MHASVVVMPLFSSAAFLNDLAMLSEAAENRDGTLGADGLPTGSIEHLSVGTAGGGPLSW